MRKYSSRKSAFVISVVLITGILSSCIAGPGLNSGSDGINGYSAYQMQFFGTFDTVITVVGHVKTEEEFNEMTEYAQQRFQELNEQYDIYNTYEGVNNACTINGSAGDEPVVIEDDLMDILEFAVDGYARSNQKVNPVFGSVLKIWHDYREAADPLSGNNPIPSESELQAAAEHTGIGSLVLDRGEMTAFLNDPDSRLDLGAMAKGYATELVCDELEDMGFDSFAISAGGNVKTVGKPLARDRDTWIIGIQDPDEDANSGANENVIDKVKVNDLSVVTSGWYQRYFISEGRIYHHIIDPETLFPQDYYKAVTVVHPDSGICDVISTALMLMTWEEGAAFLEGIPGAEAYWILSDGTVKATDGMRSLLLSAES